MGFDREALRAALEVSTGRPLLHNEMQERRLALSECLNMTFGRIVVEMTERSRAEDVLETLLDVSADFQAADDSYAEACRLVDCACEEEDEVAESRAWIVGLTRLIEAISTGETAALVKKGVVPLDVDKLPRRARRSLLQKLVRTLKGKPEVMREIQSKAGMDADPERVASKKGVKWLMMRMVPAFAAGILARAVLDSLREDRQPLTEASLSKLLRKSSAVDRQIRKNEKLYREVLSDIKDKNDRAHDDAVERREDWQKALAQTRSYLDKARAEVRSRFDSDPSKRKEYMAALGEIAKLHSELGALHQAFWDRRRRTIDAYGREERAEVEALYKKNAEILQLEKKLSQRLAANSEDSGLTRVWRYIASAAAGILTGTLTSYGVRHLLGESLHLDKVLEVLEEATLRSDDIDLLESALNARQTLHS